MSELQKAVEEYLAVRRALGFKLRETGAALHNFVSFLEREEAPVITTELVLRWAKQPADAQPAQWANRLGMIRRFAQYRRATDPRTEIPPQELLPYCYRRRPPYIYTDGEITQLLKAAKGLPSKIGLKPYTYSTLLGLIAVTGMRTSESINLNNDDVDLAQGILIIRGTKFGKSRLVPIHPSTQDKLRQYARRRDCMYPNPKDKSFFVSDRGIRLNEQAVRWTFVKLSRQIGLRSLSDHHGPRLHDLRHAFAIRTIVTWYRRGVDVEQRLPQLSTYLGHVEVTNTYWYLSVTPELLRLAAMRLDHTKGELL